MALVVPTVLVVAFSCSPAQEPRASQPKPPPQRAMAPVQPPIDRMTERQAWLGVQVEPVRSDVAMQLPLRKGAGLVVMFVESESPAEKAGLQRFDILEMVGDQFLMNVDQFNGLVKSEQPGAKVKLTWLRRGERKQADVALGERMVPARRGSPDAGAQDLPPPARPARQQGRPEGDEGMAWREDIERREMIERREARGDGPRRDGAQPRGDAGRPERARDAAAAARARLMDAVREALRELPPDVQARELDKIMRALERNIDVEIDVEEWRGDGPRPALPPMRKRDAGRPGPDGPVDGRSSTSSSSSATIEDGSIRIAVTRRNDGPAEVRVEELDGTVLWQGHVDGDGQLMDVPPEFRSQVEMLMRGG